MQDMREHPHTEAGGAHSRLLALLDSGFGGVTEVLNAIGTAWIFGLLVLINADIFSRSAFNAPVPGVPEMVTLSIVGIVFLQLPNTLRHGRLTIADTLFAALKRAAPRLAHALSCLYNVAGALLFGVILWVSYPYLVQAWTGSLYVGAEGNFTAPTWPVKLIILIGCAGMAIQFTLNAFFQAYGLLRPVEEAGRVQ